MDQRWSEMIRAEATLLYCEDWSTVQNYISGGICTWFVG